MNRFVKIIRNLILILFLFFIVCIVTGLRLTPEQAHKMSERGIHYGPSVIIKSFDYGNYQQLLCKYDNWVSCDTVSRFALIFWQPGNQPIGFKNDSSRFFCFSNNYSNDSNYLYGIINNDALIKIEVLTNDGQLLTQQDFYDGLFYFTWVSNVRQSGIEKITGYTSDEMITYNAWDAIPY